jgi:hypothetical protein
MVRVVEQQHVGAPAGAMAADLSDEIVRVPFVHQHEIGRVEEGFEIDRARIVELASEPGIRAAKRGERVFSVIANEIGAAPPIGRLEHVDAVSARQELGRDAAQEMRVAVVPVGRQRMAEHYDAQGTLLALAPARLASA